MSTRTAQPASPPTGELQPPESARPPILDQVDAPVPSASIALTSGRRYELAAEPEGDRLTVVGRKGEVLLRVTMTDRGPVLSFESAEIEIAAARKLALSADEIAVEARRSMSTTVGGDVREMVSGTRHTAIAGEDRLEAAAVQVQASERGVDVRAMGRIALDGEHIGLNDDPCPRPFDWSAIAGGPADPPEESES
jgi:hypothetical protein